MRAVITDGKGAFSLKTDVPKPQPEAGEIIVENKVIASNPTDWKHAKFLSPEGTTLGCDFAGIISELGSDVDKTKYKVGDRVAGFVVGGRTVGIGSYAEYVKVYADLTWKIPEQTSFEEAAAIGGIGLETAAMALFHRLGLPLPGSSNDLTGKPVLVWAGSTSVGILAIQLVKAAGLKVVTTASPKNFDLVKSYGADAVFDYKDPETPQKIKEWSSDITLALDCISEHGSHIAAGKALAEGSKIVLLLVPDEKEGKLPAYITPIPIIVYTAFGKDIQLPGALIPAGPTERSDMAAFLDTVPALITSGQLKSSPITKAPGSLENVQEGLDYLFAGKASAQKIVYSVQGDFSPVPKPLA